VFQLVGNTDIAVTWQRYEWRT